MRPRKKFDQADVVAAIIAGPIVLGVMLAPVVPDRFGWIVGAVMLLPLVLVVAFAAWAALTTIFRGLR